MSGRFHLNWCVGIITQDEAMDRRVKTKSRSHIFVSKRFQQQEQNGFEMLLPNSKIILPCDL